MFIDKSLDVSKTIFIFSFFLLVSACACKPGTPPEYISADQNSLHTVLEVNEERIISVAAINPWNWIVKNDAKGIFLDKGQTYQFDVDKVEEWKDADILSNPEEGWKSWKSIPFSLFFWLRRCPSEPWYALVGAVYDKSGNWHCFKIGNGIKEFSPKESGQLYVFANDMNGFYCNNSGTLELSIRRLE